MENLIIAIDQSTSATKAMLFNERCEMLRRVNVTHEQYYPKSGWVEHDAEENLSECTEKYSRTDKGGSGRQYVFVGHHQST